ncbi:MAG: hypothetical protein Q7K29_07875 [Thermoleophilia bacterium]|nr:hypothetical protein [Thermoleophilia bacterium]
MKRTAATLALLAALISAILMTPTGALATDGAISWPIRGFNYPSWWHDEYLDQGSGVSLSRMSASGANWVAIIPSQYMDSVTSDTMAPENGGQGRTASDDAVAKAIDDAHARGLKVMLKPHIDISDGSSRWDIRPRHPGIWFSNYGRMIAGYANLAETHHVELFSVGTELVTLTDANYYNNWADVISGVRSVYSGPITYAGSTTECDYLSFGGLLDYLGLDVYFPLSDKAEPTLEELMTGWTDYHGYYGDANWLAPIEQWQAHWNKPVVFTELGYRSVKYAGLSPWDWSNGIYDGDNQARAYEAAFRVLGNKPWLAGVFWWDWMPGEDTGGPGNTDYTIIDKPAEAVVKTWYSFAQAPLLEISTTENLVDWNSYADYLERRLSVDYLVENSGSGQAIEINATGISANNGVSPQTALPVDMGSLDPGNGRVAAVVYHVPVGIASFRATIYVECQDGAGQHYRFPDQQPE